MLPMNVTHFEFGPRWIWPSRRDQPEDPLARPPWWDGVLAALLVGAFLWFYGRWIFEHFSPIAKALGIS